MKILMLNYEFPPIGGGASPVSFDIAKRLAEKGHFLTVVTMAYQDLPKHECMNGIEVYRIPCLRTKEMVCHPWEQATYILSAMHFISTKLQVKDYDICYTHFIIPTGAVAWWLKRKYKLNYIITSHGSDVIGHNNKRFKWLYYLLRKPWGAIVRQAEAVVSPSHYLKELMQSNEVNAEYPVIRNGVDTQFFARSEKKQKEILVMCRLQETKNVQQIIRSLSKVSLGDWKVNIMGDGPYKATLQQLVKEYSLEDSVFFKGWVSNKSKEHLKILQETSIYLSASRLENCPTSILEALSCGARVALSDIPAHKQLIENIDNHVFFQLEDDEELAERLQKMMAETDMVNHYDMREYDWDKSVEAYEKLLLQK